MRYGHILSRLVNTPLAISQDKLNILTSNIVLPMLRGDSIPSLQEDQVRKPTIEQSSVINIFDSLIAKNGGGDSGSTSYFSITSNIQREVANGSKSINFYIDSSGGEVAGLFGLCNFIASLPSKYGIETRGFTDGSATSAAQAILSSCQKRYATEGANLGSIGVIMTLIDLTKADIKEGVKYTFLRSKEEKALYNPHEIMSEELVAELQTILKVKDDIFNNFIVRNTNVSLETIMNLKGKVIMAEEALQLGLIDGIVSSLDEFNSLDKGTKTSKNFYQPMGTKMTLEEALVQLSAKEAELQTTKAQFSLEIAKAKQEETARCLTILESATTFMLPLNAAIKSIAGGTSVEQTLTMFEIIKESMQVASPVVSGTTMTSTLNTHIDGTLSQDDLMKAAADQFSANKQTNLGLR